MWDVLWASALPRNMRVSPRKRNSAHISSVYRWGVEANFHLQPHVGSRSGIPSATTRQHVRSSFVYIDSAAVSIESLLHADGLNLFATDDVRVVLCCPRSLGSLSFACVISLSVLPLRLEVRVFAGGRPHLEPRGHPPLGGALGGSALLSLFSVFGAHVAPWFERSQAATARLR